jgi:hypothetical protein
MGQWCKLTIFRHIFNKFTVSLTFSFFILIILFPNKVFAVTDIVAPASLTTSTQPSTMRHLLKTSEATMHSFIQLGTNTTKCGSGGLWWLYSTDSGVTWTCGSQISSDTTNLMYADARADSSDNIYLVYSVGATGGNAAYDVLFRKLSSSNCSPAPCDWSVGSAQTILDGDASGDNAGFAYATLELEGTSRIWVAAREYDGTNYQVGIYYSDGLTSAPSWTVSQATLDTAGTNAQYHYPTLVRFGSKIGVIYNIESGSDMAWRFRSDSDGLTSWNSEAVISSTYLVRFPAFSAVGDSSGNIYLTANGNSAVHFTHYQSSWSTIALVSSNVVSDQFASVSTDGTSVWVIYAENIGLSGSVPKKLVYKKGVAPFATANFDSSATPVISYHSTFDKVWLYDASADTYEEETTDAASTTTADVAHSSSSSTVKDIGDIVYLGKSTTFDAVSWQLSTTGTGSGTVAWEYCSAIDVNSVCTAWSTLTFTTSGSVTLRSQSEGAFTPPSNWQAAKINSESTAYYYIRGRTDVAYTLGPIGTQFKTIPLINWANVAATTSGVYAVWTENAASVFKVRYATVLSFNSNPTSPTSLSGHNTGSYTSDTTPTFNFTLSDPEVSDTVKFRIQIDNDSDFGSPLTDYTSSLATQGSTSFTVGQAAGSGSYSAGTSGQTLSDASYYWRVKTIDNSGSESSYSTANSGSVAFIVDSTAPTTPGTPSSGSLSSDSTPSWSWTTSSDSGSGLASTAYTLQWSLSSDFSSGVFSTTSNTNSYTHTTSLADGTWYFRVKAADELGNESSFSANGSITLDTTSPESIDLNSPSGNSYTNSERPTFKWKATTDNNSLTKYVLNIDNPVLESSQPSGDFTIDNIPTSGTKDTVTDKYVVHYENFGDNDTGNNYISVYTKSHSSWSSTENDGKLREGIVSWSVSAVDSNNNSSSSSRTLYVDRTSPNLEITQINSTTITGTTISTSDKTPTFYGKITDQLAGASNSQTQTDEGPKVASGPKQVEITIEKKEGLIYKTHTIYTLNINLSSFTCDNSEITNNIKQRCDKQLAFEYSPSTELENGTYKITFLPKDNADNSGGKHSYTLNISSSSETTVTETKTTATIKPTATPIPKTVLTATPTTTSEKAPQTLDESESLSKIAITSEKIADITSNVVSTVYDTAAKSTVAFVNVQSDIYDAITTALPKTISNLILGLENILTESKKSANNTGAIILNEFQKGSKSLKTSITNLSFKIGEKTQNISDRVGIAIIKFTYNFVSEPTTISNVNISNLTPTSVYISWETNHPATGKVNYGLDRTYTYDIQSTNRVTYHEFTLTNLTPDTTYHFEVMSQNKNYVYDANREFKTPVNND